MNRLTYLNGQMIPEDEARVSVFDIGFLYGATFMEAVRTFRHTYFRLEEHLERLENSMRYAGLPPLVSRDHMRDIFQQVLEANIHLTDKDDDCWVCANVTPGVGFPQPLVERHDSEPTVIVYSSALPHREYVRYYAEGKPAITATTRNIPPQCMDPRGKSRSRLHYFMAKREALAIDPQAFAILLDLDGNLTETSGANFFIVSKGALYTSDGQSVLNGISRQTVIELAHDMGVATHERNISLYDAYNAEEAFFTTTSYCILPVSTLNGRPLGGQIPGSLTNRLLSALSEKVGVDIVGQARRFSGVEQ